MLLYDCSEVFTVSFFGHRYIDQFAEIEIRLEELIVKLLKEHKYVIFLVGRSGEFDQTVSGTIKRIKKELDNFSHILVLPYNSAEFQNNEESFYEYYDGIEICLQSHKAHFKSAIQIRNRNMIDRSDLCVFFVKRNSGGAYQSMKRLTIDKDKTPDKRLNSVVCRLVVLARR